MGRQLAGSCEFSFPDFAKKRLCRLLPPLAAAVIAISVLSVSILPADEAITSLMAGRRALLASLNIYLDRSLSAYFSANTRYLPMMHLWYMGVILQCYAVFALLFWLWRVCRCGRRARLASLLVLAFLSLCVQFRWCIFELGGDIAYNSSIYYWPLPRLWEFAMGAFAYLAVLRNGTTRHGWWGVLPLVLLLAACFFPLSVYSTRWAPLSVPLAFIVAVYGSGSFLSSPGMQFIGRISFSIYLVHWPVICFAEYFFNTDISVLDLPWVLGLIFLLSLLLYHLVEKRRWNWWATVAAWFLTTLLITSVLKCNRFLKRIHPLPDTTEMSQMAGNELPAAAPCFFTETKGMIVNTWGIGADKLPPLLWHMGREEGTPNFVLMGDSHAKHFVEAFSWLGRQYGWSGLYLNTYFHPFWDSVKNDATPDQCSDEGRVKVILSWLRAHPELKVVIVGQWWQCRMGRFTRWNGTSVSKEDSPAARTAGLRYMCAMLKACGKVPVLIAETPTLGTHSPARVRNRFLLYGDFLCRSRDSVEYSYDEFLKKTAESQAMLQQLETEGACIVIHPETALFPNGLFKAWSGETLLLSDHNHLSLYGSLKALDSVSSELSDLLAPSL